MKVMINGVPYGPIPKRVAGNKGSLAALELRFDFDSRGSQTVRGYLGRLLETLWEERESFDAKRPFGNSGWEFVPMIALAKAGFVDLGQLDEDGALYNWTKEEDKEAHAYVLKLIGVMCQQGGGTIEIPEDVK